MGRHVVRYVNRRTDGTECIGRIVARFDSEGEAHRYKQENLPRVIARGRYAGLVIEPEVAFEDCPELKNCPFCGEPVFFVIYKVPYWSHDGSYVARWGLKCTGCGFSKDGWELDDYCNFDATHSRQIALAEKWNRRTTKPCDLGGGE